MAKKQQRADQYAEEQRVWAEIDVSVTPAAFQRQAQGGERASMQSLSF
jgi:hypothetical protein